MKRNLKNVRLLKWFTFSMWLFANALILWLGKAAVDGLFADKIALGVIMAIVLVLGWAFWFIGFDTYMEIEQEIEEKERAKK
jgi:hypothetical protein